MITNKAKCLELIDALIELEIIIEYRKIIEDIEVLKRKREVMIKKILKE